MKKVLLGLMVSIVMSGAVVSTNVSAADSYLFIQKFGGIKKTAAVAQASDFAKLTNPHNIAMMGIDGLTRDSYTASSTYRFDVPAGAFDGVGLDYVPDEPLPGQANRGFWFGNNASNGLAFLMVDFGSQKNFGGFRVSNSWAGSTESYLNRIPKDVIFQVSDDGVNFTDVISTTFARQHYNEVLFDDRATGRYVRLKMLSNYGDTYMAVGELEIYSDKNRGE